MSEKPVSEKPVSDTDTPDELPGLRAAIDDVDGRILELLNERARTVIRVGEVKAKSKSEFYVPSREREVFARLGALNQGPFPQPAVQNVFREIMSGCLSLEKPLRVAYLGPEASFTHMACKRHFGLSALYVPAKSISGVFDEVARGQAEFGVVPIENSTEGGVGLTLDRLVSSGLRICGEVLLPIHHCLLSKAAAIAEVSRVYAHAQSLAQCNGWLARHLPSADRIPCSSNAEAARRASQEGGAAAIASRAAAELYEMTVLAANIEDQANNTTRFIVIGDQDVAPSGRDRTSVAMAAPNRPGALHELLGPLAEHNVSMSRFESRPSGTGLWEYVFFFDVEGHQQDTAVAAALAEVRARAAFVKILGSYPVAAS